MSSRAASFFFALALVGCSTTLERGLTEPQADEIVVALGAHGVGARKEADGAGGGFAVSVLETDVASALSILRDEGLPRVDAPGSAETYATPSLIPTAGEERARMASALSADLSRAIETLPGVHDARVQIGLPDPSVVPMDDVPPAAVASVLVHGEGIDEAAVRALVAGSVPGLAPERVTLVTTPPRTATVPAEPLVAVGPMTVTAGSAPIIRGVLAAMFSVNVALAGVVGWMLRRRR